jgi:zinc/manganese transport system substrate-binding protein
MLAPSPFGIGQGGRALTRVVAGLLVLAALGIGVACSGSGSPPAGSGRLSVVSTVTQVSALTRAVGGDRIDLTALLTSRDDPHQFELKPNDVTTLARAKVIVESGAQLDKWMDRGVQAAGVQDRVTDASKGLKLRDATGGESGRDPHWWYDVDDAKLGATSIALALERADPAGKGTYEANLTALKQRLDDADRKVHALIDPIPEGKRLFVANHDAFNYFLARYGITLVGDIVPSTDSIAAVRPADVARLVNGIRDQHVCAIFTETTIDPKLASQIASESGARVYDGRLYGDAIGDAGTPGATVEGAIQRDGQLMAGAFTSC